MAHASRKLEAIMFTDMVGYGALTQTDERLAHELLQEHRDLLRSLFPVFGGREVRTIGDAFLVEFESSAGAVECAVEIQRRLYARNAAAAPDKRIWLRIGIHLGDVIHEGGDVYGDGVNLAARIQPLAEPGGICISDQVYLQVKAQIKARFVPMGNRRLKNVQAPMKVFAVFPAEGLPKIKPPGIPFAKSARWRRVRTAALFAALIGAVWAGTWWVTQVGTHPPLPRPGGRAGTQTVLILPFENLGAEDDAYFAMGMTKEISARLAEVPGLGIVDPSGGPKSRWVGKPLHQLAKDHGTRFVLRGSVRWQKTPGAAGKVRVTPQLVRGEDEVQIWAHVYEREMKDLFDVQSDIARSVVAALNLALGHRGAADLESRPTSNMEAYDQYLRGLAFFTGSTSEEDTRLALQMFERAAEEDPHFGLAWAMCSRADCRLYNSYFDRSTRRLELAGERSQRALAMAPDLPDALLARGLYFYWGFRDYGQALAQFDKILSSRPDHAGALEFKAYVLRRQGKFEEALTILERISPMNPRAGIIAKEMATTAALLKRFDLAHRQYDRALNLAPDVGETYALKAQMILSETGDRKAALETLESAIAMGIGDGDIMAFSALLLAQEGRGEEALDRLDHSSLKAFSAMDNYEPRALVRGRILDLAGREREAKVEYRQACKVLEELVKGDPSDARFRSALGLAFSGLGDRRAALEEGRSAVAALTIAKDALEGPSRVADLARIHAASGEPDEAWRLLNPLLSRPGWVTLPFLRADPTWAGVCWLADAGEKGSS